MSLEAKVMLGKLYDTFNRRSHDPVVAWDKMVEFLAVDHRADLLAQLDHKFEWLLGDRALCEDVSRVYDPSVLRTSNDDDLGRMYHERIGGSRPREEASRLSGLEVAVRARSGQRIVVDPLVGTGRRLIAAAKEAPNGVYLGADPDLRALRISSINAAVNNVSCQFLHADYRIHDLNLGSENGRHNWQFANQWNSAMERLRPLPIREGPAAKEFEELVRRSGGAINVK
jgi:hypothetical protein